ncbi:hypothetical protein [Mucilaginibacter sp. AK015]|uniref:hypothetical protein n=1 Tax=Mucilaginibacter sp. AK015 TaxID=2723072 RepID=UPI00161DB7DC|nr:hypothetical protein [Mucilaginibacter sp. AK015]MBB5395940.1 hypothetical protein [Mucilaginibacter sp. AK015]
MKNLFMIVIVAFTFTVNASAQSYEAPKDYHFNNHEDYTKYEGEIVKTADWLMKTPWGAEPAKTEAATQFLLVWAQGTPDVVIELKQVIMDLSDANPQLGFIYMAQFSKYAIQHKADFDKTKANMVALRAVIAKYNMEPTHKRDGDIERLIELDKNNKLESWVGQTFESN